MPVTQHLGTPCPPDAPGLVRRDPYAHVSYLRDTLVEEVAFPLEQRGMSVDEMLPAALEALDKVGLRDKAEAHPLSLSGGQTRRLAIATVIVTSPDVLSLDGAFAGLDEESTARLVELCRSWPGEVSVYADREVPGLGGIVVDHRPNVAYKTPECIVPGETRLLGTFVATRGGHPKRWWRWGAATPPTFVLPSTQVNVAASGVTWLQGPNGSGKTTLMRAIAGLDGHDPVPGVSLLLQRAEDQVVDSTVRAMVNDDDLCARLGLPLDEHPLDLEPALLKLAQVAAVVAQRRPVLLCDEPDVDLDDPGLARFHELLAEALGRGTAVVLSTHDVGFAADVATYATVTDLRLR